LSRPTCTSAGFSSPHDEAVKRPRNVSRYRRHGYRQMRPRRPKVPGTRHVDCRMPPRRATMLCILASCGNVSNPFTTCLREGFPYGEIRIACILYSTTDSRFTGASPFAKVYPRTITAFLVSALMPTSSPGREPLFEVGYLGISHI
jgi:hypothetical protein